MPDPGKQWLTLSRSRFPWEQEALDFIFERFPGQDNYRAWANFEFIADDGSINEATCLWRVHKGFSWWRSRAIRARCGEMLRVGLGSTKVVGRLARTQFCSRIVNANA